MGFYIKLIMGGIGGLLGGGVIFWMGLQKDMNYPAGLYAGPLAIVLGIVLLVFGLRGIAKGE